MKKILLGLLLVCSFMAKAQYNNEWIDYSKTYYKFKLGKDGLYRLSQHLLDSVGLSNVPAEQFQLWRNGVQVPIYTSVPTGILNATDYIEFWGKMNDGKPDRQLYRKPEYQLNDKWSLLTDTVAYFLTVDPVTTNNLRLINVTNNIAGNTLPPEPYFMYTTGKYFKDKINNGYAVNVGTNFYSSSYDKGEGWSSNDIVTTAKDSVTVTYGTNTSALSNLFVYNGGPAPRFKISVSGNANYQRTYKVTINGDSVFNKEVDFFDYSTDSTSFSLSSIISNNASIVVKNIASVGCYEAPIGCQVDRMVIHKFEMTYPRLFDFGSTKNFEFTLPATAIGYYLEIKNFVYGSAFAPVLYDLANGERYVADNTDPTKLKFALPASMNTRSLVLVSEDVSNINAIASLETRNFVNYGNSANAGDYLIISNPILFDGANGGNPVEDYRAYRSSLPGGSHNAKIYLADELVDQFGFGIKKHPSGIRNFIRFARQTYSVEPKFVFIIGKGVNYVSQRAYESSTDATTKSNLTKLNLVPTFGYPASDGLLTAEPGSSIPEIPIGRLSVITPQEVTDYLNKIKEYEAAQALSSPSANDKSWMKNVVHIVGASDEDLGTILTQAMNGFKNIITDTLFGANVTTFSKQSADAVQQLSSTSLTDLFSKGISLMTYFGHSSGSTLEFNLENPENYNNQGKYPIFLALGCNAGDFFTFNTTRFNTKETTSEKYNLAPGKGTIGFIASTHFGIVHYLDIWSTCAYKRISKTSYGKSLGEILKKTAEDVFAAQSQEDFYARATVEESELHGDPAITLNTYPKADYVIEDPMVKVSPGFVSIADASFKVDAKFLNLGKASSAKIVVEVKRQFPDQSTVVIERDTIPGIRYADSISVSIPINPAHDKGLNKIIVTVDADNDVDETFENNNSVTKEIMIYEDEAQPVYPYNFAIINKPAVKLIASTANPFSPSKTYQMELDTTEFFNSPFKVTKTITQVGGTLEFDPGITFTDSTVYYWRVALVPDSGPFTWNASSFVYLANSDLGFNQSHLYQHLKSSARIVFLDSATNTWKYQKQIHNLFARNTIYGYGGTQEGDFTVSVDGDPFMRSACVGRSILFNVFDGITFKPWLNVDQNGNSLYRYGSGSASCSPGRKNNFEFSYMTPQSRKLIMDFMDSIPVGAYVAVRSFDFNDYNSYASTWMADTTLNGANNSIYHKLKSAGFALIDSVNSPRSWALIYQKGVSSFEPKYAVSQGLYDKITVSADVTASNNMGYIISPVFGPAKAWKQLKWKGKSLDAGPGDNPVIAVIGIKKDGGVDTLYKDLNLTQQQFDLSAVNAKQYPYLQLQMLNADTAYLTPYQLRYWRLTYDPAPEGAVAPNISFTMKDTVDVAEPQQFKMAFKNVSEVPFTDSIKVKAVVTDHNNVTHVLPPWKQRPLALTPDTLIITYPIDTRQLAGNNSMFIEVNPDNDQPEQFHFNNFFYKNFYVRPDTLNPIMDVTFDNVHILNHDIVSAKPDIMIKLKDEAKWFLLNDTSTVKVQIQFPDGSIRTYNFDGTTMQFAPAQQAPSTDNTATVNLKPAFDQDGEYELSILGKDMSQNGAGAMQYRIAFQVFNKPMISNMLNYPNPFTTSTAFVFTVTGSEVPQNIRIQVLTVTGKIVREITKDELGPLHIGRNITEYKWDGTDQYGQKLANGIYLYRVVTNLNGKSLDKFTSANDNTDKYFNKGYGKMYLMR
jgi:hypothetical protein